jgi:hypothetical protein
LFKAAWLKYWAKNLRAAVARAQVADPSPLAAATMM